MFRVAHTQTLVSAPASAIAPNHRRQNVMTFSQRAEISAATVHEERSAGISPEAQHGDSRQAEVEEEHEWKTMHADEFQYFLAMSRVAPARLNRARVSRKLS